MLVTSFIISIYDDTEAVYYLDLNQDGTDDVRFFNEKGEDVSPGDTVRVHRIGIEALGTTKIAQQINSSDSLHFFTDTTEAIYDYGALIDAGLPWNVSPHEMMLYHASIHVYESESESDFEASITSISRNVSYFADAPGYIAFSITQGEDVHYG